MDDLRRALPTEALGGICLLSGRLEEAFDHYGEAVRLWQHLGNDQGVVWSLCGRAVSAGKRGDLATALALTKEARQVAASAGNPTMMAVILYAEGESLLEVDPVRALGPIAETLEFAEAADNVFMKGLALVSNTSLRGRHGDPRFALRLFEEVIQHWRRDGSWSTQWITLRNLVELLARLGAHESAAVLYGACVASTTSPPSYGPEADRLEAVVGTLVSSLGESAFGDAKARVSPTAEY
jgi:tetratricopeptide (TPR) repeat protein